MVLPYPLILASNSPRRRELLLQAGFDFKVIGRKCSENFPSGLSPLDAALFIVNQKKEVYKDLIKTNLVICADTIVVKDERILGKPGNKDDAFSILKTLSCNNHKVITSVAIAGPDKSLSFAEVTNVEFENLDDDEIHYYVEYFQPFDKAGSYGIQEWIGLIGIKEIHGSYFNVVGLPINRVYQELKSNFV
jgi:septum formation protein